MKFKIFISLSLVLIFLAGALDADAQRRNRYKKRRSKNKRMSSYRGGMVGAKFRPYSYLSANVNALNYFGDLAPVNKAASTDINFTRPGMGINVGHRFTPHLAVRAGFNYGRLKGDDVTSDPNAEDSRARYVRNLHFRNDIKELHMGFEIYLMPNYGGPNMRPDINIYLLVGAAVFHHEPKALVPEFDYTTGGTEPAPQAGEWVKLRKLGTEGQLINSGSVKNSAYSPIQLAIPIGVGINLRLPGPFNAGIEFGYRYLFTDYIDDVSDRYVPFYMLEDDLTRIMSDRAAEPTAAWANVERTSVQVGSTTHPDGQTYYGSPYIGGGLDEKGAIRGNRDDNDMFFMTSLRISMILGQTRSSAKFR
ncbi:DUF6089 family protein [Marinoscillum furvescens]|uniref:DUF6089 domain-containing protein n=1 Tax=Marinoscillum furvescens DSM 4134 TaxID=1122208 RepID=A0A3D9L722_MARFU|nr:DUF6089 family protein [Marinoscillum furvescens]REE01681.1 hypothetical protein C7460_103198 [Marinoscillum furvescens DSM 4134]